MCKIITNKWGGSDCLCLYSILHSSDFSTVYKGTVSLNSITPCTQTKQHVCNCNKKPALNSAWFPCILAMCNNQALGFPCIPAPLSVWIFPQHDCGCRYEFTAISYKQCYFQVSSCKIFPGHIKGPRLLCMHSLCLLFKSEKYITASHFRQLVTLNYTYG